MNHLLVWNSANEYDEELYWPERKTIHHVGSYEHINNFNSGSNNTTYTDEVTGYVYKGTTLMTGIKNDNHEVNKFGYHNSTDSKNHFEYIILEIDGAWYVGFDFYATKPADQPANNNMSVERDWIFNDWIVKITPAVRKTTSPIKTVVETGRVFCEDLGSIGDFDFNDVVFDATVYSDGTADITILAAGGTMPLSVAGVEVHDALGHNDVSAMINTGAGPVENPYQFTANGTYTCINDIKVIVQHNTEAYELQANAGAAPHKICVPVGTLWLKEYIRIDEGYPLFQPYVQGHGDPWGTMVSSKLY
jgi:hypothetical protein